MFKSKKNHLTGLNSDWTKKFMNKAREILKTQYTIVLDESRFLKHAVIRLYGQTPLVGI